MPCAQAGTAISLAPAAGAVRRWRGRWPKPGRPTCSRDALVARAFRARQADESHRARLRVEIGRLRAVLGALAGSEATPTASRWRREPRPPGRSWCWRGRSRKSTAAVLALLADGESWSSSALALALGASQRTVQRALDALAAAGKVQAFGRGRARRWLSTAGARIHDDLVTPHPAAEALG